MIVLDSSAFLAVLFREPGAAKVLTQLRNAVLSHVNLAEILTKCGQRGLPTDRLRTDLSRFGVRLDRPAEEDAWLVGNLADRQGLSLGDRYCIATAARHGLPVVTADRVWAEMNLPVAVELIR